MSSEEIVFTIKTTDEAEKLKLALEKCFLNSKIFTNEEMGSLEDVYDNLMGLS